MKRLPAPPRGRAARSNPDNRYAAWQREVVDDGWDSEAEVAPLPTRWQADASRTLIAYNDSPDIPFDRSVNPYRGCEHGCIYCYARPSHAWLDLSPGLDFETRLFYKPDAARLLRAELAHPNYRPAPIALGANTDAWQPGERQFRLTRSILEVAAEFGHPICVNTKSALIERDLDLLVRLAEQHLVHVGISLTTLDRELARRMEPRASAPQRRLETIRRLAAAGVPVRAMVAPIIPFLNDAELEDLLAAARTAGAYDARYSLLRLPHELGELFTDWLEAHYPEKGRRVLNRLRDCHSGRLYDARFGQRLSGSGPYAELLEQRFQRVYRRLGFAEFPPLDISHFRVPGRGEQLALF
ncbi:PA0069 family radical SAM protein [Caldichromatium japonicum]|uniref:PA0069 family radical SAM protein n=1 Tax=Caldichromatium japonicum TaxID=2699430 RepID=A0A6G7VDT9_9GAMM|nr:PA0069 family radical SAM protein [Caldichromatium japonicum]QIK38122.1 PA0069 family radical SAM protein [Caldichromatium japonicum]